MPINAYSLYTSLGNLASMASRHMEAELNRRFARSELDMTVEKWRVLVRLRNEDGLTQNEIAARLLQEKTGISRLVRSLEEKGYVRRVRNEKDARSKRVYLTQKGHDSQAPLMEMALAVLEEAQKGVPPEDVECCRRVLRQVIDNMRGV